MADVTIVKDNIYHVHAGQNGYMEYAGIATFNGTDTECTIEIPFAQILDWSLSPNGSHGTGEYLGLKETQSGGVVNRDATTRKVTVRRVTGTTSALAFAFRFRGF